MSVEEFPSLAAKMQDQTLELLKTIVKYESPSSDKAHVDRLVDFLEAQVQDRGGNVDRRLETEFGDHLVVRFDGNGDKPLLVMTHIDTVWPVGTIDRLPWSIEDGIGHGPGIYDMKASAAMMLTALDIIQQSHSVNRPITWLINTDEEVGSASSRTIIEELARESACVLCLEPPVPPDDALKTERKGVGMFTMEIEGRAAHAGADHHQGVSALEELAQQILWLHSLTDYDRGTTLNVGVASGGTKRNVVAAYAEALIDLRVTSMPEAERIVPMIQGALPKLDGATVTVKGDLNRPPMERSPHVLEAFERAREIGKSIGQDVKESSTGGGSDGNFTAALGVPTIDGLGCPGHGAHSDDEYIEVEKLAPRTALIAALLAKL